MEQQIKDIQQIYYILSSKKSEVYIAYKASQPGVKLWNVRCDIKEASSDSLDDAVNTLLFSLKSEVNKKIKDLETEAMIVKEKFKEYN
jgi:hypothetical protein